MKHRSKKRKRGRKKEEVFDSLAETADGKHLYPTMNFGQGKSVRENQRGEGGEKTAGNMVVRGRLGNLHYPILFCFIKVWTTTRVTKWKGERKGAHKILA